MRLPQNFFSLIFAGLSLFCSVTSFAQSGWFPCNTGTDKNLTSVYFVNQNTGWIVGYISSNDYHGVILKTTNGGMSWTTQVDQYNIQPESVFFSDVNTGWVAGDRLFGLNKSLIKKTTNGGLNWLDITSAGSLFHLHSVFFISQNTGWVSGRDSSNKVVVIKTTNSGISWMVFTTAFTSSTAGPNLQFLNDNTGYVAALQLLKTTNSGINWNISNLGTIIIADNPFFINVNTGWVTCYSQTPAANYIKKTSDGGNNWITQWSYALAAGHAIFSTYFVNSNIGWGAGSDNGTNSYIIKTTNGGSTWGTQTNSTYLYALTAIFFADSNYGWSCGYNGRVLRTTDGGGAISGMEPIGKIYPDNYSLGQNYPNPFNPTTKFDFDLPVTSNIRIFIYDITGRILNEYNAQNLAPGKYRYDWNGENFSSGLYFYRLTANNFTAVEKMILIK